MTKSDLDSAAYQIVIFDKENSHSGALKWIAGSGVANAAKRRPMVTRLTMLGRRKQITSAYLRFPSGLAVSIEPQRMYV